MSNAILLWAIRIVLVVLAVLAFGSVVFSYVGTLQLRDVVSCQSRFNAEFREALLTRDAISLQVQEAQRRLLLESAQPGPTADQVYQDYLDVLRRADERLGNNPLPQNYCIKNVTFD